MRKGSLGIVAVLLGISSLQSQTVIPVTAVFKGNFVGRDIIIEGKVEGVISTDFEAEITEEGELIGKLETTDATISGVVKGDIMAIGVVKCTPTAEISGGVIVCRDLIVEEGALITSKVKMGEEVELKKQKKRKTTTGRRSRRRRRRRRGRRF
jgi:cytoskeletal protein CcmA (bactofilin family)